MPLRAMAVKRPNSNHEKARCHQRALKLMNAVRIYSAVSASIERFTLPEGVGVKTNRRLPEFGCLSISEVS